MSPRISIGEYTTGAAGAAPAAAAPPAALLPADAVAAAAAAAAAAACCAAVGIGLNLIEVTLKRISCPGSIGSLSSPYCQYQTRSVSW